MNTIEYLHAASQYLAAVALQFIEKKEDDSHSNLQWDVEERTFRTQPIGAKGHQLELWVDDFTLAWTLEEDLEFDLSGSSHGSCLDWINATLQQLGFKDKLIFKFHYELPYHTWDSDKLFPLPDEELAENLEVHADLRSWVSEVLEDLLSDEEIRVWPHHFDTGALIDVSKEGNEVMSSIGLGLAIPDELCSHPYAYVSGWKKGGNLQLTPPNTSIGEWNKNGFNGVIMPMDETHYNELHSFFTMSIQHIKKQL